MAVRVKLLADQDAGKCPWATTSRVGLDEDYLGG